MRPTHSGCEFCHEMDIELPFSLEARNSYALDGLVVKRVQDDMHTADCKVCEFICLLAKEICVNETVIDGVQLRAFSLLPFLTTQPYQQYGLKDGDDVPGLLLAPVPDRAIIFPGGEFEAKLRDLVSKRGYLICTPYATSQKQICLPRVVSPEFNPSVVWGWISCCEKYHRRCKLSRRPQPTLNLIDCWKREVVSCASFEMDFEPEYIALSYVWGQTDDVPKAAAIKGSALPQRLPTVIEDAIKVAQMLRYRYLWVDKYCVEQRDSTKKHEQIMHMDSVYQDAALTIIAAAGTDETYGLPGISRPRPSQQVYFEGDYFSVTSTLPSPCASIANSKWASRGWTYQEAILSCRRLVFTDEQLYFECNDMSCHESFEVSFDNYYADPKPELDEFVRPALFSLLPPEVSARPSVEATRLHNFITYLHCAEQYTKRTLTFDSDSLSAFTGIIRKLELVDMYPVRHIWGVPLFHPDDDTTTPTTNEDPSLPPPFWQTPPLSLSLSSSGSNRVSSARQEEVDYLGFLMLGLCWRHDPQAAPRRRQNLPSWSWAGWEGPVSWPELSRDSRVRTPTWPETTLRLDGNSPGNSTHIPSTYHSSRGTQDNTKSLYITTSALSRNAFTLDERAGTLGLATGARVRLYASKPGLDAAKAFRRLQGGRYEAVRLVVVHHGDGEGGDDAFLMLVKRYRHAAYRVGTLVVKDSYLADVLFTPLVKTYKLR
ncbi:heterokaryon incompatibility protein-domain-containing protein [Camillea tinctor]|nr:heterokaryon incompatibility protein-domain-containing protein [Camillea tinctor]